MSIDLNIALTTYAVVKAQLKLTNDDDQIIIEDQINVVSQQIASYCRRVFKRQVYTNQKYQGNDDLYLNMKSYPIHEVTELTISKSSVDVSAVDIEDDGSLYYEGIFSSDGYTSGMSEHQDLRTKNISVTYEAGYILPDQPLSDLPYPLQQACVDEVIRGYKSLGTTDDRQLKSWTLGKAQKEYKDTKDTINTQWNLLNSTIGKICPYKRMVI